MASSRVWDRFLTEQDQKLASISRHRPYGFGKKPCLLLIDLYRMAFGEKPEPILESVKNTPNSCGLAAWNSIVPIKTLLSESRRANIPIVFSTGLDDAVSGIPGWIDRGRKNNASKSWAFVSNPERGSRFEIIEELQPEPGEIVIEKATPSVFCGTPLLPYLNSLGIDTIIACGESTSGCVRSTVVDGRSYSYLMIVVEECVFDRTEASHAINLFDMNEKYADVISLADVLEYIKHLGNQEKVSQLTH